MDERFTIRRWSTDEKLPKQPLQIDRLRTLNRCSRNDIGRTGVLRGRTAR